MDPTRRELAIAAATTALAAAGGSALAQTAPRASAPPTATPTKAEKIALVMYPGMTALDLVGPLYALGGLAGAQVHLVAASRQPMLADRQLTVIPTMSFDETPADLDMLFIPGGGPGCIAAMRDDKLLSFLADRGSRARLVTSVCTGSAILGAAGLLKGYRATSHWIFRDTVLPLLGAIPVKARYVQDRNRITGGGVTSGIDFGLRIVAELRGEAQARLIQLLAEYDPQPPYGGSPDTALPETLAAAKRFSQGIVDAGQMAARERHIV